MTKERFRTDYNIFGNNTMEKAESESESPFNIQMIQPTKQGETS